MPSWCGLLFAYASTSCTLCSRFAMRRIRVCLLGAWSLKSVFRLWQMFLILSPDHGSQILLAYRLSWSLMYSCGMRLKVLFSATTRSPHNSCIIIITGRASHLRHWSCLSTAYAFNVNSPVGSQSYGRACRPEPDWHSGVPEISLSKAEWRWWLSFFFICSILLLIFKQILNLCWHFV
jgi:hypothetical protein